MGLRASNITVFLKETANGATYHIPKQVWGCHHIERVRQECLTYRGPHPDPLLRGEGKNKSVLARSPDQVRLRRIVSGDPSTTKKTAVGHKARRYVFRP